jgi:hypothetical protein
MQNTGIVSDKETDKLVRKTIISVVSISGQTRDSSVGIVTRLWAGDQGIGVRFPAMSKHPHRLRGPPSLLSNEYWGLFPRI